MGVRELQFILLIFNSVAKIKLTKLAILLNGEFVKTLMLYEPYTLRDHSLCLAEIDLHIR